MPCSSDFYTTIPGLVALDGEKKKKQIFGWVSTLTATAFLEEEVKIKKGVELAQSTCHYRHSSNLKLVTSLPLLAQRRNRHPQQLAHLPS
jgi:hypothetical protein